MLFLGPGLFFIIISLLILLPIPRKEELSIKRLFLGFFIPPPLGFLLYLFSSFVQSLVIQMKLFAPAIYLFAIVANPIALLIAFVYASIPAMIYSVVLEMIGNVYFKSYEDFNKIRILFFFMYSALLGITAGIYFSKLFDTISFILIGLIVGLMAGYMLILLRKYEYKKRLTNQSTGPDLQSKSGVKPGR